MINDRNKCNMSKYTTHKVQLNLLMCHTLNLFTLGRRDLRYNYWSSDTTRVVMTVTDNSNKDTRHSNEEDAIVRGVV